MYHRISRMNKLMFIGKIHMFSQMILINHNNINNRKIIIVKNYINKNQMCNCMNFINYKVITKNNSRITITKQMHKSKRKMIKKQM